MNARLLQMISMASLIMAFSLFSTKNYSNSNDFSPTIPSTVLTWYLDNDGDDYGDINYPKYAPTQPVGYVDNPDDCDDSNPTINPGMPESCNGVDDNCNGKIDENVIPTWYKDLDNDGYSDGTTLHQCTEPGGYKLAVNLTSTFGDCEDENPTINPGQPEICNGKDDNCNGQTDEGVLTMWYPDFDNDLYSTGSGIQQCTRPTGHKMVNELTSTSGDCNDNDPDVNAGATEACNGIDDDCDTDVDEGVMTTWYPDFDGDNFTPGGSVQSCQRPAGHKKASELNNMTPDCDDTNGNVHPFELETCNQIDDNCNGSVDEGLDKTWYKDLDNDFYTEGSTIVDCQQPSGYKLLSQLAGTDLDCDDDNPAINPGASEACNSIDDNCNNQIDEGITQTWYKDNDNDFYTDGSFVQDCQQPGGYKLFSQLQGANDCDDDNAAVNPGTPEICNNLDDNCNGQVNEGLVQTWYKDQDDDDYSDGTTVDDCQQPGGYKLLSQLAGTDHDCDDDNPAVNPGAPEVCNQIDDNCNGQTNEGITKTWYRDNDNDSYSDGATQMDCQRPGGYKLLHELAGVDIDCDDDNAAVNPGTPEICNNLDDNCNGQVNEGLVQTWYKDQDDDDYSDGTTVDDCQQPGGYKLLSQLAGTDHDCDDDNPAVNPGTPEICNNLDDNCNGQVNEGLIKTWYKDLDNDGYSDGQSVTQCNQWGGYQLAENLIQIHGDCNDQNPGIHPGATEICDGLDNNCNGTADNSDPTLVDNENPVASCLSIEVELDVNGEIVVAVQEVFDQAGSYDNCGTVNPVSLSKSLYTCADIGINHPTLYVNDGHGNNAQCTAIIRVKDTMKPAVSCKTATIPLNYSGVVEVHPNEVFQSGYDNCNNFYLTLAPNNFDCDDLGPNFVTLYSEDDYENENFCHSTVTIIDDIAPDIYCKTHTVYLDANGQGTMAPADVYLDSYDNCGTVNLVSVVPNTFDCGDLTNLGAENIVELTVNDGNGNSSSCTVEITVVDVIPPIPDCQPKTYTLDASGVFTIPPVDLFAGGWDNCNVLNPQSVSPPSLDCDQVGANPVILTVNDGNGNTGTCQTTVTILAGPYFTWYKDFDGDDWSDGTPVIEQCAQPVGYELAADLVSLTGDCNDLDPFVNPTRIELCNGIDDNCNGTVDEVNISGITTSNISTCDDKGTSDPTDDTFTADVTVSFIDIPNVGYLNLWGDGSATVPVSNLSGSSYTFTDVEMSADGTPIDLTADFSVGTNCNFNQPNAGFAPVSCSPCSISAITVSNSGNCSSHGNTDPSDDTFTADVTVTYLNPPAFGTLDLSGDGSASVDVGSLSGGSYTFTGVEMDADGTSISLTANFSANGNCTFTNSNAGTAPPNCCFVDIAAIVETDESCQGASDGVIVIQATSSGTMLCSINGGSSFSTDDTFTNLSPDDYNVVVIVQGQGCSEYDDAEIEPGSPTQNWYKDMDGDGYTDGTTITSCSQPTGYVTNATPGDCNDSDATQYPGQVWFEDMDGDGYGTGLSSVGCTRPTGWHLASELTATSGDCNDNDASINPGATEICNGIDDNCNGLIDDGVAGGLTYSGSVTLSTQAEVDNWQDCFSVIDGNLTIQNNGVNDLSNLINLEEITGNLTIKSTSLSDLIGLENIETVGGNLVVKQNNSGDKLTALTGLQGVTSVGGNLQVFFNYSLTQCCAIYDLLENGGVGGSITIFRNETGCDSQSEIQACPGGSTLIAPTAVIGIGDAEGDAGTDTKLDKDEDNVELPEFNITAPAPDFVVLPNPTSGKVTLQTGAQQRQSLVQVTDMAGRLVMERKLSAGTTSLEFDLMNHGTGIYLVVLTVDGEEPVTKQVVVR